MSILIQTLSEILTFPVVMIQASSARPAAPSVSAFRRFRELLLKAAVYNIGLQSDEEVQRCWMV